MRRRSRTASRASCAGLPSATRSTRPADTCAERPASSQPRPRLHTHARERGAPQIAAITPQQSPADLPASRLTPAGNPLIRPPQASLIESQRPAAPPCPNHSPAGGPSFFRPMPWPAGGGLPRVYCQAAPPLMPRLPRRDRRRDTALHNLSPSSHLSYPSLHTGGAHHRRQHPTAWAVHRVPFGKSPPTRLGAAPRAHSRSGAMGRGHHSPTSVAVNPLHVQAPACLGCRAGLEGLGKEPGRLAMGCAGRLSVPPPSRLHRMRCTPPSRRAAAKPASRTVLFNPGLVRMTPHRVPGIPATGEA